MMLPLTLNLEQTLHGYSDGHRLLAASIELDRAAKNQILTLSDMSGRSMIAGFEKYLTAYPVLGTDFYAFAQTWYAPEMERPGCVWTHTLMIPQKDLGSIGDLSALRHYFVYPTNPLSLGHYSEALRLQQASMELVGEQSLKKDLGLKLLVALYSAPDAPILLEVEDSESLCDLIIGVWNQQWPRLRANFSFCTGSMSGRSIGPRYFDLQLVPSSNIREIRRELVGAIAVERNSGHEPQLEQEWVVAALKDLIKPKESRLRAFLRKFDSAFNTRFAFKPLVELSLVLHWMDGLDLTFEDLVALLCDRFPNAEEAVTLKAMLLSLDPALTRLLYPNMGEAQLLQAIAINQHSSALDHAMLSIDTRSRRLWNEDRAQGEQLVEFLISHDHNNLGGGMLSGILSSMGPQDLISLFKNKPSILVSAVQRDPELASNSSIWSGSFDLQRELFDAATARREVNDSLFEKIVGAMIDAGSDCAIDQIKHRFNDRAAPAVLSWFKNNATNLSKHILPSWRRYLVYCQTSVLQWAKARLPRETRVVALLAQVLNPQEPAVQQLGLDLWTTAVQNSNDLPQDEKIFLCSFSLAVGFALSTQDACNLIILAFEDVHSAAGAERLGYDAWKMFDEHVPFLTPWRNWDKCERLRRGLIDRFEGNGWSMTQFVSCARRLETLQDLLYTCNEYRPSGKSILKKMRDQRESLKEDFPADVWRAIKRYL